MRVLFVTPSYFPIVGGSETLIRVMASKLNELGIKADILTLNMNKKWRPIWKAETIKDGAITVFKVSAFNPLPNLPNPLFNLLRVNVIPNLSFTKKLRNYDVLHFVGEADLSLPFLSYFIKRPKIFYCVGIYKDGGIYKYYMFKRPYFKNIFRKLFSNLADVYFVLEEDAKKLLSQLGPPLDKILVLPHSLDLEVFHPDKTKKIDNLVLFVGRLEKIKGLHLLVEALTHLKTPTQVIIIGPRWDNSYVEEIERLSSAINEKGVHKIKLLGPMDQKDLVPWYQKAAVFVCPGIYEAYSTVALEALACGTPVISTGMHILKNGNDGIFVVPKDAGELANAIKELLENRELREKYRNDGIKLVERFSRESVVKQLVSFYESVLDNYSSLGAASNSN